MASDKVMERRSGRSGLGYVLLILALVMTGAVAPASDLDALTGLVHELVTLQRAGHEAQSTWQEQRRRLDSELLLLKRQRERVDSALAEAGKEHAGVMDERDALRQEVMAQRRALETLLPAVRAAEVELLAVEPFLPALVREGLADEFAALRDEETERDIRTLGERLKRVFGLLTEVEQFNAGLHTANEVLTVGEQDREMEVLYLGLSTGYAVDPAGTIGGVGRPSAAGWQWQWHPDWAEPVREALRIYRKERPAGFVRLPLQVHGEATE